LLIFQAEQAVGFLERRARRASRRCCAPCFVAALLRATSSRRDFVAFVVGFLLFVVVFLLFVVVLPLVEFGTVGTDAVRRAGNRGESCRGRDNGRGVVLPGLVELVGLVRGRRPADGLREGCASARVRRQGASRLGGPAVIVPASVQFARGVRLVLFHRASRSASYARAPRHARSWHGPCRHAASSPRARDFFTPLR